MKIADLYIRVSTDEQADKGYSQRNQEEVLRKYCEINMITVRKVIFEDHSAKTFNRPAWAAHLKYLYKNKHKSDLVLFTKWDRFSRNAADAYQMINTLRKLGIEPSAIEQPLDLSIPENKMMLAFFLAIPEVENDRRALNVFHGMRRAKKEGRWMAHAPIGYVNKVGEDGRKYIAPKAPQSLLIQWVFQEIVNNIYTTEQIWQMARQKGLKCSKNNFWVAIRNPVYRGKIFIPKFKDEESQIVKGQHEPLISEALFYEAQDVLDGKRKKQRTKMLVDLQIPLRGFLICPRCGLMLTGSGSKGRKLRYYYYHCISKCGARFRADHVNAQFENELRKFVPHPAAIELYKQVIKDSFETSQKDGRKERKDLLEQMKQVKDRTTRAMELLLANHIDAHDYHTIKSDCERQMTLLEAKLADMSQPKGDITKVLDKAINNLTNLTKIFETASITDKRELVKAIYPDCLTYDGQFFRTTRLNEAVQLI
jgi:DNA invertase Pin-like site-specific DNA recombinase